MPDFAPRQRDGFDVRAEVLTWDLYVFAVAGRAARTGRTVYVSRRGADVARFLDDLDAGRLDLELGKALSRPPRRRLRRAPRRPSWPEPHVGVEHEYRIIDAAGRQVDARSLIHHSGLVGIRADPADPNAYRCPWGGVITCDEREIEVATAPLPITPGFVPAVVAAAAAGRRAVEDVLPSGLRLEGYSTHLNVTARAWRDDRAARTYAASFAPALMLALDRIGSPGLLVRPRPGRLELCGEFADGEVLAAATALAAGSVLALRRHRTPVRRLAVDVRLVPARERYGWFVHRTAFGPDLYVEGTAARLTPRRGGSRSAGEHLQLAWEVAGRVLAERAGATDRRSIEDLVAGRTPLPSDSPPATGRLPQPGTAS